MKVMGEEKKKKKRINTVGWQMSVKERFFYYTGDTARLFCQSILNTFITIFMVFQGIDILKIGGIMLAVKIIDAFDDVIFGFFVDRLDPKRWKGINRLAGKGKYLPWYRVTFFLYPLAIIGFFLMPGSLPEMGKIVWFTVFYLLYDLTSTVTEVPMNSMVMTLTDNVDERSNIFKIKGIIMTIAAIFIGVIWQFLISEQVGLSVTSVSIVSALIFLVMMVPLATSVTEYNPKLKNVEETEEDHYTFREMWHCIKTNKYILIFFVSQIVMTCLQTNTALTTFVSFYCYGNSMVISYATLIAFIPGLILMTQTDRIARKMGKRNAIIFFNMFSGICFIVLYFAGYSIVGLSLSLLLLANLPGTVKMILNTYIAPDTIEYTRYKTGQDCSGIFYSLNSFVTKVTGSVAQSLGMFVLGLFGWISVTATDFADLAAQAVTQPGSAVNALWATNSLIPGLGLLLGCGIMFFYTLKDKDAELMAKCNSGHITREECEAQLSRKY